MQPAWVAQGTVRVRGPAEDILVKHRTLNHALLGVMPVLAVKRSRTERPEGGYLVAGLAGLAGLGYTAHLGGRMVYEHGVGVKAAMQSGKAPEIRARNIRDAADTARKNAMDAWSHTMEHLKQGKLLSHGQ